MARKEEGVHWEWSEEIPVIWKKGPMTEKDVARLGGVRRLRLRKKLRLHEKSRFDWHQCNSFAPRGSPQCLFCLEDISANIGRLFNERG